MNDQPTPPIDAADDSWLPDPNPTLPEDFRTDGAAVVALATGRPLSMELDSAPVAASPPADAPPAPQDAAPPPSAPADGEPPPRGRERPRGEIWKGCPVKPLGVNGKTSYYLDIHGQMRAVEKHDQQTIMHLFGHMIPRLYLNFAQWDAKAEAPKKDRFDANKAAAAMISACSEKGLFDPDGAVRGVGAWSDDDGRLIYHTGDQLLFEGAAEAQEPASHQGKIYPAYPPIPHPVKSLKAAMVASTILETFATWRWTRGDIDPMVCLGMIGIQMMGGALDWRPTFWATGPKAAGKSSFQKLVLHLHGGEKGLIQSNDATKSGITSRIGHSSLPVALDELEPGDEGSSKEKDIIILARVASSGGQWYRGSADQKGAGGNVYSTFLFSSILIPGALKSQDLSRLVILSLQPFEEGTPAPTLRSEEWRKRGAELKRLLIDRWPTWRTRLDLWREAFGEHGIGGRNADNWATIMAMAQMALSADLPTADELQGWCAKVAAWVTDAANGDFVRSVLQGLPRSARNAMFDAGGLLNAAGARQLREALFARAWPDPDILARFTEGNAGELKSLLEALDEAAPAFAALKADIEAGLVRPEMDISGYVLDAMRLIAAAREVAASSKVPMAKAVQDLLEEIDLIDGAVAPLTAALVRKFWTGGKAAKAEDIAAFLTRYADEARKAGSAGGMFDAPGPRDVLMAIDRAAFGDLPEDLGNVRGFARPGDTARAEEIAATPVEGFEAGAASPEAEAVRDEIRAELETPPAAPNPTPAQIAALREAGMDDFEVELPDGTTTTLQAALDDLDADQGFDAFIQACGITPAGGAQ